MEREELAGALIGLWRWASENAQSPEPPVASIGSVTTISASSAWRGIDS